MKNLMINIFKTLFFFDLAVLVFVLLPDVTGSNVAMTKLKQEALILAVPLALTLIYSILVERRRLSFPINRHIFKAIGWGLFSGIVPIGAVIGGLAVFKKLKFVGIEKPEHLLIWLAALLCNALAAELLLRGYLFSLFKKHYGFIFSAVVTTLLFVSLDISILNKPKIYVATVILMNFLLCLILEYSGSLIATVITRFLYTAISGLMFGSMKITGGYPTILEFNLSGKKLLTGGEYGFEGSLLTLIAVSLFAAILLIRKYKPIKFLKETVNKISHRKKRKKVKKSTA